MNYARYFAFLLLFISSLYINAIQMPAAGEQLSEQDQMMLKEFSNMSEEEQMQMWNAVVAEVEGQAQALPESEREQFLNAFWQEVAQEAEKLEKKIQNTPGFTQPFPEVIQEPEIKKSTPTPQAPAVQPVKPATGDKIEQLKKTIESILSRLSSFMTKTALIPDMPTRMIEIKKQGFIASAPADFSWVSFKRDLERFIQQLHMLLDKDPKTKQPKYLSAVDEGLRNNLNQLNTKLSTYESKIETTDFSQTRLGKESKNAFNFVANAISELFYVLKVPQELEKVFGTYDPRKQELIKEKEALQASASRPSGPTMVRPISSAGIQAPELAGKAPAPYKFGGTAGSPDYGMGGGFERSAGFGGAHSSSQDSFDSSPGMKAGLPSSKGSGMRGTDLKVPQAPSEKDSESKGSRRMTDSSKPKTPDAKDKKDDKDKDKKGDDILKEFYKMVRESLFSLQEALSNRQLKDLAQQILSPTTVNLRTTQAVEAATKNALTAANRVSQWRLKVNRSEDAIAKSSKEDAEDLLEIYQKVIQSTLEQITYIRSQEKNISDDKKYAFIDGTTQPTTADLVNKLPIPISVYELGDALNELLTALKNTSAGR